MKSLIAAAALAAGLAVAPAALAQQAPSPEKAAQNASTGNAAIKSGMTVRDANGVLIGEIARIKRNSRGEIAEVTVEANDGTMYRVAGATLTVQGDVAVSSTVVNR